ncbi:hypothetical protein TBR22_A02250 [Luteitalea sp. TBR-22]|uniref:hypothetical protein n=1 Tax=Luteitalea sp. TBR-22 TaxID=2802971 RepID=UPI001AFBB761|nr:hypothetical protein [Luteitalea sp. TBR-22]BCS31026.1 hypothetical protein TBR22_A02250 [Luteitalea sp. TBR-22]
MRAGLDERVKSLEETSVMLRSLPDRMGRVEARLDDVEAQILRSREELTTVIHATADQMRGELRDEMHGIRDELRTEMYGIRDELRAEMHAIRDELRGEMREMTEELKRHMAVLLEHAVGEMHALFDASRNPPH